MGKAVGIIGGGYAGLCAAAHLAIAGHRVTVFEAETQLCTHSSGRNAAMFRHLEPTPALVRAAQRSRAIVDGWCGDRSWLAPRGALYVADRPSALAPFVAAARAAGLRVDERTGPAVAAGQPWAQGGARGQGLFVPDDGVMDIHAMQAAARAVAKAHGARFLMHTRALEVTARAGRVDGVRAGTEQVPADIVVNAAGAWAGPLCAPLGAPLPLAPLRRHLVLLAVGPGVSRPDGPALWALDDDECYVRPEGRGVLASPGDEAVSAPCLPVPDPDALDALAVRLARLAPGLAEARVQRHWACLRTFAADRQPVLGPDPRVPGLFVLAGLGGHGMTLGAALGADLAASVDGAAVEPAWATARLTRKGGLSAVA